MAAAGKVGVEVRRMRMDHRDPDGQDRRLNRTRDRPGSREKDSGGPANLRRPRRLWSARPAWAHRDRLRRRRPVLQLFRRVQ